MDGILNDDNPCLEQVRIWTPASSISASHHFSRLARRTRELDLHTKAFRVLKPEDVRPMNGLSECNKPKADLWTRKQGGTLLQLHTPAALPNFAARE
jgi:hypothetical protein